MTLWYTNRLFCLETVNKPGYFSFSISTTYCQRQVCIFIQPICHFFFFLHGSEQKIIACKNWTTFSCQTFVLVCTKRSAFELESRPNLPDQDLSICWICCSIHFGYWATLHSGELWSWFRTRLLRFEPPTRGPTVIRHRPNQHLLGLEGTPTLSVFLGI